jgi:hypothetical protein
MMEPQKNAVRLLFVRLASEIHHGDCVGADAQAHYIARELGLLLIGHPPINPRGRAFCVGFRYCNPEKPYLERNRDIVGDTHILVAAPETEHEVVRSGTWYTVRWARKLDRSIYVVMPDGEVFVQS